MPSDFGLPADLIKVAQSLEEQSRILSIPGRMIGLDEWDCLTPRVRELIPRWLMDLLASHRLAGLVLERPHEEYEWDRYFAFWGPSNYAERITPDDPVASRSNGWWLAKEIIGDGFIPLCNESDGDMWITSITEGVLSPVYLYDLSGRKRKLASENMALFLASCKISKDQST